MPLLFDLLKAINDGLLGLDLSTQIQLSMDGPSVNLNVLNEISKEREDAGLSKLINVGSCNLHVVHGALKSATEATGWNLKSIMKSSFQVLKDSPARREDYISITYISIHSSFCCWLILYCSFIF